MLEKWLVLLPHSKQVAGLAPDISVWSLHVQPKKISSTKTTGPTDSKISEVCGDPNFKGGLAVCLDSPAGQTGTTCQRSKVKKQNFIPVYVSKQLMVALSCPDFKSLCLSFINPYINNFTNLKTCLENVKDRVK